MKLFILICVFIILMVVFIGVIIENKRLVTNEYTIHFAKWGKNEKEVRIAFLTDLHNNQFGKDNVRLLDAIVKAKPDFILIAGDMLIGKEKASFDIAISFLAKLSQSYEIYYANGNHEHRLKIHEDIYGTMYRDYQKELHRLGIHHLINESIKLKDFPITVTGLEIEEEYFKRFGKKAMDDDYISSLVGDKKSSNLNILIAHNPIYFKEYARWGADLTVSGHVHGGMVKLPFIGGVLSPQIELFPKFDSGLFKQEDKYMVLSPGLGNHSIKIRLFNPPELSIIRITNTNEGEPYAK